MRTTPTALLGALWLAAFAARGAVARAPERHVVPLRFYGTRPAVEVKVNGAGPFLFLVDTGAGGPPARADTSLVRRLGLSAAGRAATSDGRNRAVAVDRVVLGTVELGGLKVKDVEALSRDYGTSAYLPKIDGIIGLEFFRGWLVTIDFTRRILRFERGALPRPEGRSILSYQLVEGNAVIDVTIGGRKVKATIDTGNIRAFDLPSDWLKPLRLASFPRPAGGASGANGTAAIREVQLADPLLIGSYRFKRPAVTFADEFGEANIGSTLLQGFVVTIDHDHRTIRLVRRSRRGADGR